MKRLRRLRDTYASDGRQTMAAFDGRTAMSPPRHSEVSLLYRGAPAPSPGPPPTWPGASAPIGPVPCGAEDRPWLIEEVPMKMKVEHKLFIDGRWTGGGEPIPVRNKYSGEVIATIPSATRGDVDAAIAAAVRASRVMAEMPAHRRAAILAAAATLIQERREEFARTIAAEAGKALKYARIEVDRGISTFTFASEEAKRLHGETVPLDAAAAGEGYFRFYVRRPVGVIVAISPFNFPLNLVAHKVAPALAAANTVVLKPATWTPLTAVLLVEALTEAGLPAGAINLITGPGSTVGNWLVEDDRVNKITFTGSAEVGRQITARAGIKKI